MSENEVLDKPLKQHETWVEAVETYCANFSGECGLVILDAAGDSVVAINPRQVFSAASVIKLAILFHYGLLAQEGRVDPQQRLPLRDEDKVPGSGVLQDLQAGSALTINDLATLMIILSDNTATNMLIDLLGADPVNETVDRLGLGDMRLRRKMYDWEAQQRGLENVTSAHDVARLLLSVWHGDQLQPAMRERLLAILRRQQYRGKLPFLTPDPERWANKTGELPDADHDAGFLFLDESAVIVALLTSGGSGKRERVQLANQIGKLVYEQFA